MTMFEEHLEFGSNSVLLATDLSSTSETAMAYAVRFARRYNAKITALQVFDYTLAASPRTGGLPCGLAIMHSAAQEAMQDLQVSLCKENVRCEVMLIDGDPVSKILDTLVERNIDLAVLGTGAKEGWDRLAWGSVAEQVLRKACCPVLTVGPNVPRPSQRELPFRKLLYATDFSAQSLKAAPNAVALANDFDACLHLLHVLPFSMKERSRHEAIIERLKEVVKNSEPVRSRIYGSFEYELGFGDRAAEAILERADVDRADLAILGVRRASRSSSHLPDITSHIIGEAKCPVLTISS